MLLLLGTFMDMAPLIVITTPIFLPVAMGMGVDPVHFGIIMMLNLGIGLVTPPVGSVLFVGSAVGKIPVDVEADNIDMLCFSGHKIYGPKGVGALYVRRRKPRVRLVAQMDGGGHERGMRSGTLNVPGIVGLGKACAVAEQDMQKDIAHSNGLRERFEKKIFDALDYVFINGDENKRLPGCSNLSFAYVEGESLIMGFKDLAVSSGSACTSASLEPSHVLQSMEVGDELAHSSIRFGFGRMTTEAHIDFAADQVIEAVKKLRELSPLYEMVQEGIDLSTIAWTGH